MPVLNNAIICHNAESQSALLSDRSKCWTLNSATLRLILVCQFPRFSGRPHIKYQHVWICLACLSLSSKIKRANHNKGCKSHCRNQKLSCATETARKSKIIFTQSVVVALWPVSRRIQIGDFKQSWVVSKWGVTIIKKVVFHEVRK